MSTDGHDNPGAPAPLRTTRFSDVCGTTDELKRLLHEQPEVAAAHPQIIRELVADQVYMLGRMELRLREYQQVRDEIGRLHAELAALEDSQRPQAEAAAEALLSNVAGTHRLSPEDIQTIVGLAESIRTVAGNLEQTLRGHKERLIALGRCYEQARGGRPWPQAPAADATQPGTTTESADWRTWLPESPHREHLVECIGRGRAHVLWPDDGAGNGEATPLVQFEDGGLMKLPEVRWSDGVRNFYPASQGEPPAQGRGYRGAAHRQPVGTTE